MTAGGKLLSIARREKSRAPMEELSASSISVDAGVAGDFRGKRKPNSKNKRQVTVLPVEGWDKACANLGTTLPWTTRRANLLIKGITLGEADIGKRLQIGTAILEITGETDPCSRMDAQYEGLTDALTPEWRGGVTCRVIADGDIKAGDPVTLL